MPMKQYESHGYMSQTLWHNSRESYTMKLRTLVKFQQFVRTIKSVSLFIKFDVRSKRAFTSLFLMFTRHAQ